MGASARIERAELPVQRNRTLSGRAVPVTRSTRGRRTRAAGLRARTNALRNFPSTSGRHRLDVEAPFSEKRPRVRRVVFTPRLDLDLGEPGGGELGRELRVLAARRRCSRPTVPCCGALGRAPRRARPRPRPRSGRPASARGRPRAGRVLVGGEIDHAVGDDDVDGIGGQRDRFDRALEELDVVRAGLALILAREGRAFRPSCRVHALQARHRPTRSRICPCCRGRSCPSGRASTGAPGRGSSCSLVSFSSRSWPGPSWTADDGASC